MFDCDLIDLHYLRHESLEFILKQRRHFLDFEGCSQSLDRPLEILLNICVYLHLQFLSILFVRPLEVAPEGSIAVLDLPQSLDQPLIDFLQLLQLRGELLHSHSQLLILVALCLKQGVYS